MEKAEFDKFAEEYRALHAANISASGETPEFFAEYKVRDVAEMTARAGATVSRILDFGSGVGTSVPYFRKHFPAARITCADVSTKSLDIGARRFPDAADFMEFDGARLPFADGTYDLAFAACVFHHIPHDEHVALLAELRRVLAPGGWLVVFEHNPLNPLTVHAVNTCSFDENARLLPARKLRKHAAAAGFRDARVSYRIFFPRALRALRPLERHLQSIPLGAQYSMACRRVD